MRPHRDLPLERDQSTRFLPWIVAVMVFLAALALAAALIADGAIGAWNAAVRGRVTVQLPPDGAATALDAALALLRTTPGVVAAEPVPAAQIEALLEPWLGDLVRDESLPLPAVIDLRVRPGGKIDLTRLEQALNGVAPGATVDDHGQRLAKVVALARSLQIVSLVSVLLIAMSATATIVFVTRSGLSVHAQIIKLLHFMGASDRYVARQFEAHALRMGIRGSAIGGGAAAVILLILARMSAGLDDALAPSLALDAGHWAAVAGVPVAAVIIAVATARTTTLRALARMP